MGFLDSLKRLRNSMPMSKFAAGSSNVIGSGNEHESVSDYGGTRTTIPAFMAGGGGGTDTLPRKTMRELGLDERSFKTYTVEDLIDTLIDAHPDMSYALWNYIRTGSSGYSINVYDITTNEKTDGVEEINELINRLSLPNYEQFEVNRSFNNILNQFIFSCVVTGACSGELVLMQDFSDVAFIAPVNPNTVEFHYENDRFIPYQDEGDISLDIPTFFYSALDSRVDDPYGRAPFISAISTVLFQLQVLNDIKAVVHNQGYPRIDVTVLEEILLQRMPINIRNNEEKKQEWLNDKLQEIVVMYEDLEPDDAFVHYDGIVIDMAGGKGGGVMLDPEKLMGVIDNLIMSGLKTLSTILGRRSTGNTESFAKLEVKLYLQSVKAIQDVVADLVSKMLTTYLNIRGKQGIVRFNFKPVEIRTELEKAQFEQIALQNYAYMRDQGWITQDEAAYMAVGHDAVSEPLGAGGESRSGAVDEKGPGSSTEQD